MNSPFIKSLDHSDHKVNLMPMQPGVEKKLIVLGDSYTTPHFCVAPKDSFWGLLGKDLQVDQIINYSHNGLAFDLILHILLNESFDWENSYFFIGVPPVARVAMFLNNDPAERHDGIAFDKNFNSWPIGCNSLTNCHWQDFAETFGKDKYFLANYDHGWQEVLTLEKIYLTYTFLKSKNAKFLIANLTAPIYFAEDWEVAIKIMNVCNSLPECILFKNTQFDVNKNDNIKPVDRDPDDPDCWFGHHGPLGNKNWYHKIVLPSITALGWLSNNKN